MARLTFLLALCALIITIAAASPPQFCKCTCFTNSTIIELSSSSSCSACNKEFCLTQRMPICQGAADKDVFTTCFQRDSRKDQIVVITFIIGTLGLLAWAAVRKVLGHGETVRIGEDTQEGYAPVGSRR